MFPVMIPRKRTFFFSTVLGYFKKRILERAHRVTKLFRNGFWDIKIENEDIEKIGSR